MVNPTNLRTNISEGNPGKISDTNTVHAAVNTITSSVYGLQELGVMYARIATRDVASVPFVAVGSSTAGGQGATNDLRQLLNRFVIGLQTDFPVTSGTQPSMQNLASNMTLANGIQHIKANASGANSGTYLTSTTVAQIVALNPAVIMHIIGSNDYSINMAPSTYKANIISWLDQLDAGISGLHIHLLIHAHRRTNVSNPTYAWSTYGQQLKDIAEARDGVVFIDLSSAYAAAKSDTTDPLGYMLSDKIHMTDQGHALGADILRGVVRINPLTLVPFVPTVDATAPVDTTAPTISAFTVMPGNSQNSLSWSGSDNVAITRWLIKRSTTAIYDGTSTSYIDTGLTNGTSYSYTAQAFDAAGNSVTSSAVTASPVAPSSDTTPPSTPTNLLATPSSNSVVLSWTASTDNVAVTGYRVRRGGTLVGEPTATNYTDTGLSPSTNYSYTVSALDAAGNESTQTSAVPVTTSAAPTGTSDYVTGMLFDYDADSLALADGSKVSTWSSQAGSLGAIPVSNGTAASQPTFAASQINGHSAVRFVSTASTRLLSSTTAPVIAGTSVSYVYVLKRTGASTRLIGGANSSGYHTLVDTLSANGLTFGIEALSGTNALTYSVSVLNRWIIVIVSAAGASSKMVIGNEATVTGTLNTSSATGISIGGSGSGSGYGTFDLAKYRAYDHALSDTEISTLKTYLNSRYSLT